MTATASTPDEQGYNGWKNYETWCVSLWLDNDQGTYTQVREIADQIRHDDELLDDVRVYRLADALSEFVDELPEVTAITEGEASFVVDLLGAALHDVDWAEIAANLLSE